MPSPLGVGRRRRTRPYPAGAPCLGTPPFRPERGADPSRRPQLITRPGHFPAFGSPSLSRVSCQAPSASAPIPIAELGEPGSSKNESREDDLRGEAANRAAAAAHASAPATPARFHPLSPAPHGPGPMGRARLLGGSRGGGWDRRQCPPLALAHWLRTQGARRPECSGIGCRGSRRRHLLAGAAPVTPGGDWLPGLRGSCLSGSR